MNQAIAGDDRGFVNVERAALIIGDAPARFFDDQRARGDVPWFKSFFPKPIEAARGYVSEIERGRAVAPHTLRVHDEIREVSRELISFTHIVGKTGAEQSAL